MSDPQTVTQAISRVMAELPGIGKDSKAAEQQGGYRYRGIEAITREAQRLFAKYGVVFVPHVVDYKIESITVNNKPWTDTILTVNYTIYGPLHGTPREVGGDWIVDDSIEVGPLIGIGRDNSDKGANKAITQAFKYAMLQILCVSDAADDADGTTHEADDSRPATRTTGKPGTVSDIDKRKLVAAQCQKLGDKTAQAVRDRLATILDHPVAKSSDLAGAELDICLSSLAASLALPGPTDPETPPVPTAQPQTPETATQGQAPELDRAATDQFGFDVPGAVTAAISAEIDAMNDAGVDAGLTDGFQEPKGTLAERRDVLYDLRVGQWVAAAKAGTP